MNYPWLIRFVARLTVLLGVGSAAALAQWQVAHPAYQTGFPFAFSAMNDSSLVNGSSVAVADLNGDNVPELVVGTKNGRVMAYRTNGTRLWVYPSTGNLGMGIESKPAIADIDLDGFPEVVVSVGTTLTPNQDGRLVVLSHTGSLQCEFLPNMTTTAFRDGIFASPALAELNTANAGLEIAVGAWDGWFRVLRSNCTVLWERHLRDSIWSSAAIADLDRNGELDIVVGSDSHLEGPPFNTLDGGILRNFKPDGSGEQPGFPKQFNEVLYSSPALGDINGDGFMDIVIGTGRCWDVPACSVPPGNTHPGVGEYLLALDRQGNLLPGWPVAIPGRYAFGSPALADLDGDNDLEVIVATIGKSNNNSRVEVLRGNGTYMPGWPVIPTVPADCVVTVSPGTPASPAVVDLTGDGLPEIIIPMNTELVVLDRLGNQLSRASGCAQPSGTYQMILNTSANASPTVADLDGDGDLEVIIAGGATFGIGDISAGALYAWDFPVPIQSARHPWSQFRHDVRNLGVARPEIFRDGFESGNLNAWSAAIP